MGEALPPNGPKTNGAQIGHGSTLSMTQQSLNAVITRESVEHLASLGGPSGLASQLGSSLEAGIPSAEADSLYYDRISKYGTNQYDDPPTTTFLQLVAAQLRDTMLRILIAAALFSLTTALLIPKQYLPPEERDANSWIEGVSLLGTVLIVVLVGAGNEWEKQKQFQELDKVKNNFKVKVLRGGDEIQISTNDVLVGDVVLLDTGDQVPADGVFISGYELALDESSMTGENESQLKDHDHPFLISGTRVTDGVGRMLVLATGMNSRYGKLMSSMNQEAANTPLQDRLDGLAGIVVMIGMVTAAATLVALMTFWIIKVSKQRWEWGFLIDWVGFIIQCITIIVVSVPEGMPLAVTISLAFSMKQMMDDQNLVRRLAACETMGGATTICSDKTGTLTENRMTVVEGWIGGHSFSRIPFQTQLDPFTKHVLAEGISLNSKAIVNYSDDGTPDFIGNKTECALLHFIKSSLGVDYTDLRGSVNVERLFPFNSEKKCMSTLVSIDHSKPANSKLAAKELKYRLYCKGASEVILGRCKTKLEDGKIVELSTQEIQTKLTEISHMAEKGLRTLALTYRDLENNDEEDNKKMEKKLTLIAILGIMDPVRAGVPEAVRKCQRAGIVVRMVTGDNATTAKKISEDCGIYSKGGTILEGPEFQKMSNEELDAVLPTLQVLARAQPMDKLRLVERLQALGNVVAVTGDGTNDAPALKLSDVGLAMGIMGTEVAKSAADIIILDDNFVSIVRSVLWGRNVYDNIQKFIQFQLTVNIVALITAFTGAVTERGTPLKAVQLLWVNLIMDTFAALALGTEKPSDILLHRRPYGRDSPLITSIMWRNMVGQALFQVCVMFSLLFMGPKVFNIPDGRHSHAASIHYTMIFNTFVYLQIFNEFNARSVSHELINVFSGLFNNWIFCSVVVGTACVQFILVEFCGPVATTVKLSAFHWLVCIGLSSLSIPLGFLLRLIPTPPEQHEKKPLPSLMLETEDAPAADQPVKLEE